MKRYLMLFGCGGSIYILLEKLVRGRTHYSMFIAGGLALSLTDFLRRKWNAFASKKLLQIAVGGALITLIELVTGVLFNKKYNVWDYRTKPLNFKGQICPHYSLLWGLLSVAATFLCKRLDNN